MIGNTQMVNDGGRFGSRIGIGGFYVWWRYDLTAGVQFILRHQPDRQLRFYGITIGEWAIGVFVRRREVVWDIDMLRAEIFAKASKLDVAQRDTDDVVDMLYRLHRLARSEQVDLPAPNVTGCEEATINIEWVDWRRKRIIGFTITDVSEETPGRVWMHSFDNTAVTNVFDPTDQQIVQAMRWIAGRGTT